MRTNYLSLEGLALNLSLPKTYLRRLVESGKIPYIDTGNGRKRFQEKAVRTALEQIEQLALSKRKKTILSGGAA